MKNINSQLTIGLSGRYKVAVVDAITGQEIWRQPEWKKNLILNSGMDHLAVEQSCTCMKHGIAGLGNRWNAITSSTSSGSVAGGWFMLDPQIGGLQDLSSSIIAGHSGSLRPGDVIVFEDGTQVTPTGSVYWDSLSDLSASVTDTSLVVTTQSFTIWKTSQTGLQFEWKRAGSSIATSSYLNNYNGTEYNWASGSTYHYRTYDFGAESGSIDFWEVGIGWHQSPQSRTVFSRIRLDTPVTLSAAQRLRLVYGLTLQYSPTASVYTANVPIAGWPVAPSTNTNITSSLQSFNVYTAGSSIPSNGTDNPGQCCLEPSSGIGGNECWLWLSADSQSLLEGPTGSLMPSFYDRPLSASFYQPVLSPYPCGSFSRHKYYTFGLNDSNSDRLWSCGVGGYVSSFSINWEPYAELQALTCRFDQPQVKTNEQTLTLGFRWTWGRTLA